LRYLRWLFLALPAFFAMGMAPPAQVTADAPFITLASTTSTEQSGLFRHVVPPFTERTGIHVRVIAVGTGQAFTIGRRGDADALLVHHREAEEAFVADGFGTERRDVMYNDFILIGPRSDPAEVAGAATIAEALTRIFESRLPFTSRGDDSGTHRKELELWQTAGLSPRGRWYRELGSSMGSTLNTAAAMNAYVLADRGTWLSFRNRQELEVLFDGDPLLFNGYGSIPLSPDRFPWVKADLAWQWHEWITSPEGQQLIGSHAIDGLTLFFPSVQR
jgi:tungstate transport system substrate-binding protein